MLQAYVVLLQHHRKTLTIGVKEAGEYRQLNSNILQIENEFYSLFDQSARQKVVKRRHKHLSAVGRVY